MTKTFQSISDADAWQQHYDLLAPKKGDIAPDFELRDVNGEKAILAIRFRF